MHAAPGFGRKVFAVIMIAVLIIAALVFIALRLFGLSDKEEPPERFIPAALVDPPSFVPTGDDWEPAFPEPEPEPRDETFCLSFVGDCTLGSEKAVYGQPHTLVAIVGDDYDYPFTYTRQYFEDDDFTMVNLEGPLTDSGTAAVKTYCFRGPTTYVKILSGSSVECASLANNHSRDYGAEGLENTKTALYNDGVAYVEDGGKLIYETERGLKIGVCGYFAKLTRERVKADVEYLKDAGAQIVVVSFHFGTELSYEPNGNQIAYARLAIDSGADIVYGQHPHVLQRAEKYKDGMIFYSLGNFCFGGNRNPDDKDTVLVRQFVTVTPEGDAYLSDTEYVPFSLTSTPGYNDYRPMPYEPGSPGYDRVLKKLGVDAAE